MSQTALTSGEWAWVFFSFVLACISFYIAGKKGRSAFLWGFFTFFITPLFIAILVLRPVGIAAEKEGKVQCPFCKEWIFPGAKVCRFCNRELPDPEPIIEETKEEREKSREAYKLGL